MAEEDEINGHRPITIQHSFNTGVMRKSTMGNAVGGGWGLLKKHTIGVSALVAFNNNKDYTFEPLKQHDEKNMFFGLKPQEAEEDIPASQLEQTPDPIAMEEMEEENSE